MKKLILLILVSFVVISCVDPDPDPENLCSATNLTGDCDSGEICSPTGICIKDSVCTDLENNIDTETTLDGCYNIKRDISVNADLEIKAGSTFIFGSNAKIVVNTTGSLKAIGTADKPILFTGEEKTRGYWGYIDIYSNTTKNELSHVILEYGGNSYSMLYLESDARLKVTDSLFQESKLSGFYLAGSVDQFERVTSKNNEDYPGIVAGDDILSKFDYVSDFTGNGKDFIKFNSTNIEKNQIWRKLSVPIFVETSLSIDADLEITEGSTFVLGSDVKIVVNTTGSLKAIGTAEESILFTGEEKTRGYWGYIDIYSNTTKNELSHVILEYGGNSYPMLYLESDARLKVTDSLFQESKLSGFYLAGSVDQFEKVTSKNNENYPGIVAGDDILSKFDSVSNFTGNGKDFINFNSNVDKNQTWEKLTVPILVSSTLNINAVLEIKAGFTLVFESNTNITINTAGSLKAIGTAEDYITFEGKDKTKGYWNYIDNYSSSDKNTFTYCNIEDATKGFYLEGDSNTTITNSKFKNNEIGIYISNSNGIILTRSDNSFEGNDQDIVDDRTN